MQLFLGFDVELADAGIERVSQFIAGFTDTGEDDLRRQYIGCKRPAELTAGDNIRPGTSAGETANHSLIIVRLQGIAHQGFTHRLAKGPKARDQRGARINVAWRAELLS